jgi:hypothetical protein
VKRKDLKDTRGILQKFFDGMYGAPEYTFYMNQEQLNICLDRLNCIDDKNWRIKALIENIQNVLQYPKIVNGIGLYTITLDTSDTLIVGNFVKLNKDMLFCETTDNGLVKSIKRY